jgi:hypothetical protein
MIGRDTNREVGIDQINASQNAALYSAERLADLKDA